MNIIDCYNKKSPIGPVSDNRKHSESVNDYVNRIEPDLAHCIVSMINGEHILYLAPSPSKQIAAYYHMQRLLEHVSYMIEYGWFTEAQMVQLYMDDITEIDDKFIILDTSTGGLINIVIDEDD